MEKRGRFITLEGIEGCGKTTQHRMLGEYLRAQGIPCLITKQPGGTAIGQKIRKILLDPGHTRMTPVCEALLYLADRAQHHAEVIQPQLAQGIWVVSDRYQDSTVAYQGAARGIGRDDLNNIFRLGTGGLQPDLTILLDLDPEVGLQRARQRNVDEDLVHTEGRFEDEDMAFHYRVRESFLKIAEADPDRFTIIDAGREPDLVAADIRHHVDEWVAALV
ncbi:MAG: dTMP kinase [Acidobacteriota bacterium]|nr:dTMP kinase [Acidobacteriota bacterium]